MTIDVQGAPADRHLRAVHATVGQASTRRLRVPLLAAAWWWLLSVSVAASALYGDEVRVAAAANFSAAAREIGELFADATGHRALLSFGSSGQLYAQITQGAPFDVFLAADRGYPRRAVQDGHAVAGSVFTYATGRLVLFSADRGRVTGSAGLEAGSSPGWRSPIPTWPRTARPRSRCWTPWAWRTACRPGWCAATTWRRPTSS